MADVFISYVEEDGGTAQDLAAGLEAAGYSAWYYERDSIPGPSYFAQVTEAIEQARAVVLLISRDSLGSNQVSIEVVRAHESGKPFVPVLLEITHAEFRRRQPVWGLALGASTSIRVPSQGVAALVPRIVQGLGALGIEPSSKAAPRPLRPEAAPPKPAAKADLITNSIGMKLKLIPAGRFRMGSEKGDARKMPVHEVTIAEPFYIGVCPVTQAQYLPAMGTKPSHFKGPNRPVECVTWNDAVEFCRELSKKEGKLYCLPTEAEWEYACRAGSTAEYCFGDSKAQLGEYAWFDGNSGNQTHDVGQKKPNAWGLCDMHGNVWEWCEDLWHENYESAPADGRAWRTGGDPSLRVLRGGSWDDDPSRCCSARRAGTAPSVGYASNGCRVVLRDF